MLRHSTFCLLLAVLLATPASAAPKPAPKPGAPNTSVDPYKVPPAPPLPSLDKVPRPVPGVFVETTAEKPRLAILFSGTPPEFTNRLGDALEATHRFSVVVAGTALDSAKPKLVPGLMLPAALAIRNSTRIDMAVTCTSLATAGELRAKARLVDLRTGEVSRELAIFGQNSDVRTLAKTLALYIRQAAPLRCLVNHTSEDEILLDLGKNDGVQEESIFRVVRYPQNLIPVPVATVKVTKTDAFRTHAEVEESRPGFTIAPGDVAIEDTGDLKI
ncbi:MAG: hypothetical protein JWM80_3527 [Cyanobacteria bacterium RYN_339]|nr:hypothetical protein [Cyanobacteria bacterium RYN_339]